MFRLVNKKDLEELKQRNMMLEFELQDTQHDRGVALRHLLKVGDEVRFTDGGELLSGVVTAFASCGSLEVEAEDGTYPVQLAEVLEATRRVTVYEKGRKQSAVSAIWDQT